MSTGTFLNVRVHWRCPPYLERHMDCEFPPTSPDIDTVAHIKYTQTDTQ